MQNKKLYKNKYRIQPTRLLGYDYSRDGAYFVTICIKNNECLFGKIVKGQTRLSTIGTIVQNEWQNTPVIRQNVKLDRFVVMPNHLHGIVITRKNLINQIPTNNCHNKFGPQSDNLSAIIRGFKGAVTKQIHQSGYKKFRWQPRYYDRIVRNQKELERIREYIQNNPAQWQADPVVRG